MEDNDSTLINFGIDFLETEIDDVVFQTNEFLTDSTNRNAFLMLLRCKSYHITL